jgi:hemolysin activation/secretion protein
MIYPNARRFAVVLAAVAGNAWSVPALAQAAAPQPPQGAATQDVPRFDIRRFDVEGNTLLDPADIARLLAPWTGAQRDFGDVQRALEALESAYHARGYSVVQVALPEQELNGGVVRLQVLETRLGKVRVTGQHYFDEANIRRSLPALREGSTPDLPRISDSLKQANENPAKKVTLKLQSGERDDEVDAVIDVADERPWSGTVNLDNTGTSDTGRTHAGVVLQNANLWGQDHVLSLQYTTTLEDPSKVSVYGVGYHLPLYASGDSLDFFGSYSDVDSGTVAAGVFDLAVSGKGAVFGARYNQHLGQLAGGDQRLVYGLDYKAYKNNVVLLGENLGNDVTVHPLGLSWLGSWTLAAGTANLSLGVLHNIPGGARGSQADFTQARAGASAHYSVLRFAANLNQAWRGDWQTRLILNGQYSNDALIPGEQFGAGGATSVRGFDERLVSEDSGVTGNAELYTPSLCANPRWQCRMLAFYDSAYLSRSHALAGEIASITIASAGIGWRVQFRSNVNLQADYGHVTHAGATGTGDRNRLHFRLGLTY